MSRRFPSIQRSDSPFPIVPDGLTNPRIMRISSIVLAVCEVMALAKSDVLSGSRKQSLVRARQMVAWIAYHCADKTQPEIGRRIGWKDHTTVWHGIGMTEARVRASSDVAALAERVIRRAVEIDGAPMREIEIKPAEPIVIPPAPLPVDRIESLRAKGLKARSIAVFVGHPFERVAAHLGVLVEERR